MQVDLAMMNCLKNLLRRSYRSSLLDEDTILGADVAAGSNERILELKDLPILRRLGQGHSGYLYETEWGGEKCARKDFPLGSVERKLLFESEVQSLFDLDHPNIVKCLRYTLGKSSCSLLQEYVDSNLQNTIQSRIEEWRKRSSGSTSTSSRVFDSDDIKRLVLSRGKKKEIAKTDEDSSGCPRLTPETFSIIVQIATGMEHLHQEKVVHGDLKPRNVLLYSESGDRKVKLADFGLYETKKRITLVSERSRRLETVTWKAPECLRELLDDEEVNKVGDSKPETESDGKVEIANSFLRSKLAMADVYSFGLTCSYILCGKVMDSGMSLTKLKKRRMRDSNPKLPSACPEHLKLIIVSCLKLDPSSRPTFTDICAALQSRCYFTSPTKATEEMVRGLNTLRLLEEEAACSSPLELPGGRWLNKEATDSSALEPHNSCVKADAYAFASRFSVLEKAEHWNTGWEGQVEEAGQVDVASNVDFEASLDARSAVQSLGIEHLPLVSDGFDELTEMSSSPEAGYSAPDWLCNDEFEGLPHFEKLMEKLMENENLRTLWPTEEFSALRSWARKWKMNKVQLLFEPSLYLRDLRSMLEGFRESYKQHGKDIDVPPNDQIEKQLNEAILFLRDDDGACMELLRSAENEINKQFVTLLRKNPPNTEGATFVGTWLEEQLGKGIKQELKEITVSGKSFLEDFLIYVNELEESNCSDGGVDVDVENTNFDRPLDEVAREAIKKLGRQQMHWVLAGFAELTKCTKGGGKLHVFREKAIPVAIDLAKADYQYAIPALTLLEALTSSDVGEENVRGSEKTEMILTVSDHLEYFIKLMKDMELPEAGLLAAKTVVNMLVNAEVWRTARIQHDIVSALLSISSCQGGSEVCLVGLTHLAAFSSKRIVPTNFFAGYKTNIIQKVLLLLSVGLKDKPLENLAKDTLVALDMEDEVSTQVAEKLRELMDTREFYRHSTLVGRVAIVRLMTKLCKRNKVCITENLILYLLVMIEKTGKEMRSGLVSEDLKTLQRLAVELFCYCVKHEKDKALSVLTENESERRTLEGMLEKEDSGIQVESRLEILEILETVIPGSSRTRVTVALLVKMATSESAQFRAKVASMLLKFAQENEPEMQDEGAFDALMALSEDENADTRGDALLALDLLSRITTIQTEKLSFRMLSPFLRPDCEQDIKEAVARLLGLVNKNAGSVKVFLGEPDSRKSVLHVLEKDPTNPSSRECASGLLKLATEEDDSVRLELASAGLGRLIKFVMCHGTEENKALLTTVLCLLCENGNEVNVIKAEGHEFLVSSLGDNKPKEAAVRGLWILLNNPATEDAVLGAGFVSAAMRSINSNFASTEMALALATISSSSKGLDEIVRCGSSEGALLCLLERCPSIEGKGAAATVIAKLYPKLAKHELRSRQEKLIAASSCLFKCLQDTDKSQLKEFLKALAAVASGEKGINSIHEDRGVEYLIQHFEPDTSDSEVRRLVLQIFAEISIVFTKATGTTLPRTMLKDALIRNKVGKRLCLLPLEEENAGNLINLLTIIRNYSHAGEEARGDLGADDAVHVLLEILKGFSKRDNVPEGNLVHDLVVRALVQFMEDAKGRKKFIASQGIETVAVVLKRDELGEVVLSHCIFILAKVANDPGNQRDTCKAIFNCDVLTPLKDIMFRARSPVVKLQAVDLVHLVVLHARPTSRVCIAIYDEGMLAAVSELLQNVPICKNVATKLLKCVRAGGHSTCRNWIDREMKKLNIKL